MQAELLPITLALASFFQLPRQQRLVTPLPVGLLPHVVEPAQLPPRQQQFSVEQPLLFLPIPLPIPVTPLRIGMMAPITTPQVLPIHRVDRSPAISPLLPSGPPTLIP